MRRAEAVADGRQADDSRVEVNTAEAQQIAEGVAQSGGLDGVTVQINRGGTTVTAEVTGTAPAILDVVSGIHETASAPLERVTQP